MRKFEALLSDLRSDDVVRMRDAFVAVEQAVRDRALDGGELEALALQVERSAVHSSWQTRRAVAHCLRYLRSDDVDPLLARLMKDDNDLVAKEAQRAVKYRHERSAVAHLPMIVDERMQHELDRVERVYNRATRDAAVRAGLAYTEFMVDAMNHQVRAAMMPVGAALEALEVLLGKRDGTDEELSWVRSARTHLGQTGAVLKRSLAYVKQVSPTYRAIAVRPLIESALDTARVIAPAHDELEVDLQVEEGTEIEAVADLLREALVNVLKNAVEASAHRKPIRLWISVRRVKGNVEIVLRDEGSGMTRQECEHDIWRPYGSRKKGGTGLGMPLVKKIVEVDHRGKVQVTSAKGEGTAVTFVLPTLQRF